MPDEKSNAAVKPSLVLIPGLLSDETVWMRQSEALRAHYDIIVPDLTSFSSIATMADAVFDASPARFAVAGHSMGARVALQMIATVPDRIERLALLDTGVHPRQIGEAARRVAMTDLSAERGMTALAESWLPPMVADGTLASNPELRSALFAMVERMSPEIHYRQISALLYRPDARAMLASIQCPVLIGVGEQDRWSPPAQHEEILSEIPHAMYVVFPKSGHMAPMENPEAVTAALRAWLALPSPVEVAA